MRVLIPGGSGQVGTRLARHLYAAGHEVTVLSRDPLDHPEQLWTTLKWDGLTAGPWASEIDRSDAVIHLSGRSINCRFTPQNRRQIIESRVQPTLLLGKLIAASPTPPRVWINASAVVYYPDPANLPQDEFTPAGRSPAFSDSVMQQWEAALAETPTPRTRRIRLRTSLMMSPDVGGIFAMLSKLARLGLGGTQGPGTQFVSWMHDQDYCRAVELLLERPEIADASSGVVNMCAPGPLPNREFQRALRQAWNVPIGLPASTWMLKIGARLMGTEPELILISRRVVPAVLQKGGFQFRFPEWPAAAADLAARSRKKSVVDGLA
jgi:uncharacterized protein (TIGR01777 family)